MKWNQHIGWAAGTASVAFVGLAFAGGETPANDTDARIQALERQIAELKAESNQNWLTDDRAEEIRALVQEVVTDAEGRTSLLAQGGGAGWDERGFHIKNDDGSYALWIRGQVQFRGIWNTQDDSQDDSVFGFENTRTKLDFQGNLFNQDFTYRVRGDFGEAGDGASGNFELRDAWGRYQVSDELGFKWGQFKAPFIREELIESEYTQSVERSYVNELTTVGYTQGVGVDFTVDQFRLMGAFTDGATINPAGPNGELSNSPALATGGNEYAFSARGEFLVAGEQGFEQFDDLTSWQDDEYGTLIGGAIHWQESEFGTTGLGGFSDNETEVFSWTVDGQVELGGANVFGSFTGVHTSANATSANDVDQFGVVVQGGFFVMPDEVELFGRWEYFDFDDATASGFDDEIQLVSGGVNWFWEGHAKKWTTDLVWAADGIPAFSSITGLLEDSAGEEDQFVLRSQIQFLF